ncbi:MAG: undecaprenyl-diphosphate phosphatase [Bacilli bacterium]|nr:undecaprenyl-diphosphate phosphatase [Bacilli bacterium]MBR3049332.1 undecaprenyl-diphosphate phosphatase [Bacilli bacterium]
MTLITYIFLGLLQGITEPIPVSSSGHLLILQTIFKNLKDMHIDFETLAVITNFGSLVAIVILFRKEIIKLIKDFFSYIFNKDSRKETKKNYLYSWKLVVATIPAGVLGIIATKIDLLDKLEENVKFVGITLIITAIFLFLIRNFKGKKSKDKITFKDAFIIGLYQMVSIIPGISRSGATIVGGMFQKLKREEAFNFSFLMYIPISIATTILGVKDLLEISISSTTWILYIIAAIVAGIFTYIFTKWFAKIVKEGKLIYFSIYCLVVGVLVIIFL